MNSVSQTGISHTCKSVCMQRRTTDFKNTQQRVSTSLMCIWRCTQASGAMWPRWRQAPLPSAERWNLRFCSCWLCFNEHLFPSANHEWKVSLKCSVLVAQQHCKNLKCWEKWKRMLKQLFFELYLEILCGFFNWTLSLWTVMIVKCFVNDWRPLHFAGPADAIPSSTTEWATYDPPDEIKQAFTIDTSDCAISKQTIACAGMTVYHLVVSWWNLCRCPPIHCPVARYKLSLHKTHKIFLVDWRSELLDDGKYWFAFLPLRQPRTFLESVLKEIETKNL